MAGNGSPQNPLITALHPEQSQSLINALAPAPKADHYGQYVNKPTKFYGQYGKVDADAWLFSFENYCRATFVPLTHYKNIFPAYLEGRALIWARVQMSAREWPSYYWDSVKWLFIGDMKPVNNEEEARDQWGKLKQTGAAKQYVAKFAEIMLRIPTARDAEAKQRFIDGLKQGAKIKVKTEHPAALRDACRIADDYDRAKYPGKGNNFNDKSWRRGSGERADHTPKREETPPSEPMEIGMRRLTEEEKKEYKKKGLCCNCGKKGHMFWQKDCPNYSKKFPNGRKN